MKKWFAINNIQEFAEKARSIVYQNFGQWNDESLIDEMIDQVSDEERDEMDKILSHNEAINIITSLARKQTNKTTKDIRYIINDKLFASIIEDLNSRMVSNILNNLVNKGLVESSYDSEVNDFVFWLKENDQDQTKPETD